MQLVGKPDQLGVVLRPRSVLRRAVHRRGDLLVGQAERPAEGEHVHAPLVLGAGPRAGAVNDDLALARLDAAMAEDARPERSHPRRQLVVDGQRAKQAQRLGGGPGRHPLLQERVELGLVGRLQRRDPWLGGLRGHG